MVCRTHKYADGGKIVKDHSTPEYPKPTYRGVVKDRLKSMLPSKKQVKDKGDEMIQKAAPKSITQRKSRIDQAIEDAGG
jgi:hypothetical protein